MDDQKSERKQASSHATLQNVHETIESEKKSVLSKMSIKLRRCPHIYRIAGLLK